MAEKKFSETEYGIEKKIIIISSIAFWIAGLVIAFFFNINLEPLFTFDALTNAVLITLSLFVFSILFFGRLTPFVFLVVGFMQSANITQNAWNLMLIVPMLFAAYSGTMLGNFLMKDLQGRDNVFLHGRKIAMHLGVAVALALVLPFLISYLSTIALS